MALDFNKIREKNGITINNDNNTTSKLNFDEIRAKNGIQTNTQAELNAYNTLRNATSKRSYVPPTNTPLQTTSPSQETQKWSFYNNVVEPTNNFMNNAIYGTGENIAKFLTKYVGGTAYNIGQAVQGKRTLSLDEMQQVTDFAFDNLKNKLNKGDTASNTGYEAGKAAGYILPSMAMGGSPLAYGANSAIQTAGNTNDVGDIAISGATGTAFGALNNGINQVTKNAISNVLPITNTNMVANVLKNVFAGGTGMYGAGAITGEAKNLYNVLRNREVTSEDWKEPVWSNTALSNFIIGGAMGGYTGTKTDLANAKAQLTNDYNNLGRNLVSKNAQIKDALSRGDVNTAKTLTEEGKELITNFTNTKYLGYKVTKDGANILNQLWQDNVLADTNFYTPNNMLNAGTETPQNTVANINNLTYNNMKIGETRNIPTNELQVLAGDGGYRTDEQIADLRENIRKNGITEPIEIYQNSDGTIGIENGNHRLKIANELGIKNIPVKMVESWDSVIARNKGENVENVETSGRNNSTDEERRRMQGMLRNVYDMANDRGTTEGNVELLKRTSNGDQLASSIQNKGNDRKLENSTQSSFSLLQNLKEEQFKIIQQTNPMKDDYHVGIRNINDIKTFEEAMQDGESFEYGDFSKEDAENALQAGKITVYSSNPIKNGSFVSTSQNMAKDYSGNGKIYSMVVPLSEVAWINGDEGQYAKVNISEVSKKIEQQNINRDLTDNLTEQMKKEAETLSLAGKTNNEAIKNEVDTLNMKKKSGFMLVDNLSTYKKNVLNNNAKRINDLITAKNVTLKEFDTKIAEKEKLLASKKDKTTKVAQNLANQIATLKEKRANAEADYINKIDKAENHNGLVNKVKAQVSNDRLPTRKEIKNKIITETDLENINLDNAKDLSKFIMNNTTPQRVNEKIFNKETADKINNTFFKPIKVNEADRIRFLNKERDSIRKWGIEAGTKESSAVQMYGEGEWVDPINGEKYEYTLDDLKKQFSNDWEKIKKASEDARQKYDSYLDTVNKKLNEMGYDSIPKLKNYFRHFEEVTSLLDQVGIPSKADKLPTDLNGITADLRPGKNFFANALKRTGDKTSYDAVKGIDGYLEGVSKIIYHTEDIQKLRTLDEYIRGKYGRNAELDGLSKDEFATRVKQIQEGNLSEYAAWLSEYTNNLAGKKSRLDRGAEEAFGRGVYGTLNAIKKQVGSNLTGLNVNSALSNFISATQGASNTSKIATIQGFVDTVKNIIKDDGFIDKSNFLTTRFGSEKLAKTTWEKISNAGQLLMSGTDYFTANMITRSKYHEYLNKGYPEKEAIAKADEFADKLMAGRGLGDMPNFFNSKTLGILTQFQLENVNQFDSMFFDNFNEDRASEQTKYEAKSWNEKIKSEFANKNPKFYNGAMATFTLGQLFVSAWAFNKLVDAIGGTGGAFDPIGTVSDLVKDWSEKGYEKALQNFVKNVLDDIPYVNLITGGGRIPMTDSIPNLYDLLTGESKLSSEAWKILNLALPTGGGQLRKTLQGGISLINNGEYGKRDDKEYAKWLLDMDNKSIGEKIKTGLQALTFGKYGPKEAKQYIESGFKGLSTKETEAYNEVKKTGMSAKEFQDVLKELKKVNPKKVGKDGKETVNATAKKAELKSILNDTELTDEQKRIMYGMFYEVK